MLKKTLPVRVLSFGDHKRVADAFALLVTIDKRVSVKQFASKRKIKSKTKPKDKGPLMHGPFYFA